MPVRSSARAIPRSSTGEKFPLVTSPAAAPSESTSSPAAAGAASPTSRPCSRRRTPAARSASSARRPRNGPLSQPTTQRRPACSGVIPGPSSWPCSGSPASRRRVSRAPSPAGWRRRRSRPATAQPPARPARRARRRPRRCSRCRRRRGRRLDQRQPTTPKRGTAAASTETAATHLARRGPCTAITARRGRDVLAPERRAAPATVLEAFGITSKRPLATHQTIMSSSDRAVRLVEQVRVLGPPGRDPAEVVGQVRLQPPEGVVALEPARCRGGSRRKPPPRGGRRGARRRSPRGS